MSARVRIVAALLCAFTALAASTEVMAQETQDQAQQGTTGVGKSRRTRKGLKPVAPAADAGTATATAPAQAPATPPPIVPMTPPPITTAAPGAAPAYDATPAPAADDDELYRCKKYPTRAKIKVTLKPETELKDLVTWVMGFTCKSFIYGNAISGRASKVTIIAPSEMSPQEAYRLFLVSLQTMNLTVVPKGRILEIVESPRAKESPLPVYKNAPASDQIVRAIFRPENVTVDDLAAILNSLKSRDGVVTPLPNAGAVIVTDYGYSIRSMAQVSREIDAPAGGDKVYIVPVRYADATELAQKLSEIFGMGGGGAAGGAAGATRRPANRRAATNTATTGDGAPAAAPAGGSTTDIVDVTPSKIIPDTRTNALIVIASERAYARILALVKRLDVALESGDGQIHVYALENSDAEEMSNTLGALITGQQQASSAGPGGQPRPRAQAQGNVAPSGTGGAAPVGTFEGNIRVTHDKPTNSLVIVASQKDFFAVREVIRKLDIPRRQVFLEASIFEVSIDMTRKLGLAYHGGKGITVEGQDAIIFGGVEHSFLSSLSLPTPSGLFAGVRGDAIPDSQRILGVSVPSFGVSLQLLQNNNDVNVLSSPNLLMTDNIASEMTVGQNIPFQSGIAGFPGATGAGATGAGAASFGFPLQSIQRQDVALKLKITPHLNDSDFVRLEIEIETSDIASKEFAPGLGPSWTKRTVKSQITVKEQQPVVLGGLMQDKILSLESKVPLLGDIPILGYLFKYTEKTKQKTNLLIFLTPYIIKDQLDIQRIFEKKVEERRKFIEAYTAFQDRVFKPDVDYTRKRGFLEEMNQQITMSDQEDALLRASLQRQNQFEPGAVEVAPEGAPLPPPPGPENEAGEPAPAPEAE